MRVFKRKAFARFQRRERIDDADLAKAVRDISAGLIDADLGGGLIKQRVARKGQGKRGGFRTIIAFRAGTRALFLHGFAKSERENIDDDELAELRRVGRAALTVPDEAIEALLEDDTWQEVDYGEDEEDGRA